MNMIANKKRKYGSKKRTGIAGNMNTVCYASGKGESSAGAKEHFAGPMEGGRQKNVDKVLITG
jgi:hypothetical protein